MKSAKHDGQIDVLYKCYYSIQTNCARDATFYWRNQCDSASTSTMATVYSGVLNW